MEEHYPIHCFYHLGGKDALRISENDARRTASIRGFPQGAWLPINTFKGIGSEIGAWVVLPTHYHILSEFADFRLVPPILHRLHNGIAYEWNKEDGFVGKRKAWFRFFDRLIRSEAQFFQAPNYIHTNPVKHGCVKRSRDWDWSSLGVYYEMEAREWLRKTWCDFPPGKLNFDRFDM